MKILYLCPDYGTAKHRRQALERLGHEVDTIDLRDMFGLHTLIMIIVWKFSGFGLDLVTYLYVRARMKGKKYEFCLVDHGELVSAALVRFLKKRCNAVACYNSDNPFLERTGEKRWRMLLKALPYYDSFCTPRLSNIEEAYARGARHVIRYIFAADEVVHNAREFSADDEKKFASDVSFVGTWLPERGPFILELLKAGVPVKVFGPNWRKAPEYELLKSAIVMDRFLGDEEYVRAVQYAKISLGMLYQGYNDLHTSRSAEIPAIGSLLCAKRTEQHLEMYEEGVEAVFWDDAAECSRACLDLLSNPARIARIAKAGHEKIKKLCFLNEPLMEKIVTETLTSLQSDGNHASRAGTH